MKDTCGDPIEVTRSGAQVFLRIDDSTRLETAWAALSPKKARRLAKALRKAAKEVEAR